ncbi:YoaK family protein [Enterococcus pallens]
MMETKIPIHETLIIGALLAMAAGSLDAYTYLVHGEVFAGLQTGNLILLGIHLFAGTGPGVSRYLIAIGAFMIGTVIIRLLQQHYPEDRKPRRQLIVLAWEIICIVIVALFSAQIADYWASALLSITAAAQLQEFRKLKGAPFTSLMMTGNLRTLAADLADGFFLNDKKALQKAKDIGLIIVSFVFGATLTSVLVPFLQDQTILLSGLWLVLTFVLLIISPLKMAHK